MVLCADRPHLQRPERGYVQFVLSEDTGAESQPRNRVSHGAIGPESWDVGPMCSMCVQLPLL